MLAALQSPQPCRPDNIEVKIVDYCQRCNGTLNLSLDALSRIANPSAGRIKIEYGWVS